MPLLYFFEGEILKVGGGCESIFSLTAGCCKFALACKGCVWFHLHDLHEDVQLLHSVTHM